MKLRLYLLSFCLSTCLSLLLSSSPVLADYSAAFSSYSFQYSQYRNSSSRFNVARSAYLTYRTLAAQNTAITSFRQVLQDRNALVAAYYNLLQEKLNDTPNVDPLDVTAFSDIRKNTQDWLKTNNVKISASASIEDLNSVSSEFAQRYPQIQLESKQTTGRVLLAKGSSLDLKLTKVTAEVSSLLSTLSKENDVSVLERGILQAQVKHDLFRQKRDEERAYFFPADNYNRSSIELLRGQQLATAANQYLNESVSFLLELVKTITD